MTIELIILFVLIGNLALTLSFIAIVAGALWASRLQ